MSDRPAPDGRPSPTPTFGERQADRLTDIAASYLDALSLKIFRYISSFHFLIREADSLPHGQSQLNLDIVERFAVEQRETEVHSSEETDTAPNSDPAGIIDADSPNFQASIQVVQGDIRRLLEAHYPNDQALNNCPQLRDMVAGSLEDLVEEYGSISHAWDCLVGCKQRLALPATHEFAIGSWHVACVSETERLIRETVLLTLTTFGATLLHEAIVDCFDALDVELDLDDLLQTDVTAEAISRALLKAMRQGSHQTVFAAERFSAHLNLPWFADEPGIAPGLLDLIRWIEFDRVKADSETESLAAFRTLLSWRRQIIHLSVLRDDVSQPRPVIPLFAPRTSEDLAFVAQFLGAVGLRFALDTVNRVLALVGASNDGADDDAVAVREWKLAAELRVLHLDMLKAQEWGLAWAAAEPIASIGDRERQDMPRLNAFYSRIKLGENYVADARREIATFKPNRARARYDLIKRSILEEWENIDELLDVVVATHDMSLRELDSWPALEPLRHCKAYNVWLALQTD